MAMGSIDRHQQAVRPWAENGAPTSKILVSNELDTKFSLHDKVTHGRYINCETATIWKQRYFVIGNDSP